MEGKTPAPEGKELYVVLRQHEDEIEVWVNGVEIDKEEHSVVVLLAGETEGFTQSAMVGNVDFQALSIANLLSGYPPEILTAVFKMMGANVIEKDIDDIEEGDIPFQDN
ncbi:MAG: hypothetical protein KAS32_28115 [Candidatus Peribacteraceae bacterium]|nr:hypothetical protein [Candidatus Peribacteraceae bacterium]